MASHKMSEENLEKKMLGVSNTQDSIQSLSLWLIHHKSHHKRIVDVWLQTLKKSNTKHQLTLLNLCNDVVQNGKRKKALIYLESFRDPLKEAVVVVRGKSIIPNVERILKIWMERSIFPKTFVEELIQSINKKEEEPVAVPVTKESTSPAYTPSRIQDEEKILAEFKPQAFIEKINAYKRLEGEVELKGKQLSNLKLDASSVEAVKQLKDRAHGNQFIKQFEDSCSKLENYMSSAEKKLVEEKELIEMMTESEVFYDEQFREAKIVANAYKNFGNRINNLRKKLDELIKSLPSPVPSPSYDAPSPGNTPPLEEIDNREAVDMDLDDDEAHAHAASNASTSASNPNVITIDEDESYDPNELYSPSKPKFTGPTALDSRITNMIPSMSAPLTDPRNKSHVKQLNMDSTPVYNPPVQKSSNIQILTDGETTPVKDEGSSTPVMDEKEDSPPPAKSHQNPIDFLTQILSKTTKSSQQNSNFLQNLSLLTNTVKSQFQQNKDPSQQQGVVSEEPAVGSPRSWSEWKAQNQPNEVTDSQKTNTVTASVQPAMGEQRFSQTPPLQTPMAGTPALYSHPHVPTESVQSVPGLSTTPMVSPPVSSHLPHVPAPQPPTPPTQPPPMSVPPGMPGFPPGVPGNQPPPPPAGPNWMVGTQPAPPPPGGAGFHPQNFVPPNPPGPARFQGDPSQAWNNQPPGWNQSAPPQAAPTSQAWPPSSLPSGEVSPTWAPPGNMSGPQPGNWQPPPAQDQSPTNWNIPPHGRTSPDWSRPAPQDHTSPPWAPQQQGFPTEAPWNQQHEPSADDLAMTPKTPPALPPPPKGILRNRRESSLREVPITPSADGAPGDSEPRPPVQPPSPVEGKQKFLKTGHGVEGRGSAPDDHREFLEKLKRKTTNKGNNLISPPVLEDSTSETHSISSVLSRKPHSNLTTITTVETKEENSNNGEHADGNTGEDSQQFMQIQKVQVERRFRNKSHDIRYTSGAGEEDMEEEEDYNHGGPPYDHHDPPPPPHTGEFRTEPRFRGPRPPPFRASHGPPPPRGFRDPFWRGDPYGPPAPRRPPPPFRDHFDPYRRPHPRF